jgi:lycopene beta-cyclase
MQTSNEQFDILFAGGGMAAASLLLRLLEQQELKEKKILIADPHAFSGKEKTWCFWEKGKGFFENLIENSWENAWFHSPGFSQNLHLKPYRYKMLRSTSLFRHTLQKIDAYPNVKILRSSVNGFSKKNGRIQVAMDGGQQFDADLVFSSIPAELEKNQNHFYLLQHFRGWFIRSKEPVFDPGSATLMDFRIDQKGDCRFVYVLPSSSCEALVEYTVFSESLLNDQEYEAELLAYVQKLAPGGYDILQKETGVIPMYSAPFPPSEIPGLIQIGTAGGMTKASTGYTFMKVQKHADAIIRNLLEGKIPNQQTLKVSSRFSWFDRVLLRILAEKTMPGKEIFRSLFQKNEPARVFRFLDEDSSVMDELNIMNSVPTRIFMMPGLKELFRKS